MSDQNPTQQDLLKLALSLSDASAPTATASGTDIEWLRQMLSSLESTEQKVQRLLSELSASVHTDVSASEALLEQLQECAEDLDIAVQIAANAGELLVRLLAHDAAPVRQWAAFVVATCAMNNRRASVSLLDAGALAQVMARLAVETEDDAVVNKLVTALSALTNDASPTRVHFLANGGMALLEGVLSRSLTHNATRAKVLYVARKLISLNGVHASQAFSSSARLVEHTVAALSNDDAVVRTNASGVISALLQPANQEALTQLRNCGFQAVATQRLAALRADSDAATQHEDEIASVTLALAAFANASRTVLPSAAEASTPLLL
jgi:hypothetical protein